MELSHDFKVELAAFHITEVCSHSCPMCYANASLKTKTHPDISKLMDVANALIDAEVGRITLLGGDPAKYPHIIKLAKKFFDANIHISILSNTLDFEKKNLNDALKYINSFETTLHSSNKNEHDEFCKKKGAFDSILEKLKFFSDNNKVVGIAVNITPLTYNNLLNIVELLINKKQINIKYIIVQRIIPMGRAAGISSFLINREHAINALRQVKLIKERFNVEIIVEDPFPLCILPENLHEFISPCRWGISSVSVNINGDLSRCGADPRYRMGNIITESLHNIWKSSNTLNSFRKKTYLPGRCHVCEFLKKCGGGCSLSCEIEKDHGIDYMFSEIQQNDKKIHGDLRLEPLRSHELSSVLQIEWSNFAGYGHVFSVDSIRYWYKHNPTMFWVVKDRNNWIMGYSVIVPISENLFNEICLGKYSSLIDFPKKDVKSTILSDYYHIEVIASIYRKKVTRPGSFLIKKVGELILSKRTKFITASPIREVGVSLCKFFGFKHIADEKYKGEVFPVYMLNVNNEEIKNKLKKF